MGGSGEAGGIELAGGSFGAMFPSDLFVTREGHNQPAAQSFKLVSRADVTAGLTAGDN